MDGSSFAVTTQSPQLTKRDQFWLDHEVAQAASGQNAKQYAASAGVSVHAFYQARKRLRALGLLATPVSRRKPGRQHPPGKPVSFSKVTVTPGMADSRFRLELPSGVALEWSGGDVPESVAVLLERLARPA